MPIRHCRSFLGVSASILPWLTASIALAQGAKQNVPGSTIPASDADHIQQRNEWSFRGRLVPDGCGEDYLQWYSSHRSVLYALWLVLPGIVIGWPGGGRSPRQGKLRVFGWCAILLLLMLSLLSCAGVSTGGGATTPPNNPISYAFTVTGTSSSATAPP